MAENVGDQLKQSTRDRLAIERTRLANERTMLAYARTAIIFAATGVTLIKLGSDQSLLSLLGWPLIAFGGCTVILGVRRFRDMSKWLR